jgi:predicted PurR-regulated permease PerM
VPAATSARPILLGIAVAVALWLLWALRDLAVLVVFATLLAYLLDPLVSALERVRLRGRPAFSRAGASALVVVALLVAIVWALVLLAPRLFGEVARFTAAVPATVERLIAELHAWAAARGFSGTVDPAIEHLRAQAPELLQQGGGALLRFTGRLFGGLGDVLAGLMVPLLAYYLLAEREGVRDSAWRFVPQEFHPRLDVGARAADRALKSYVRGQVAVCVVMGTVTGLALWMLGLPLPLLLAVIVGLAEIVPYLGFAIAVIAVGLVGYTASPWHALMGVGAYAVLNNVIGMLVTPRLMGRHLEMHPFVVTVSVLAGAQLLGGAGALVALPVVAVLQALISDLAPRPARPRPTATR